MKPSDRISEAIQKRVDLFGYPVDERAIALEVIVKVLDEIYDKVLTGKV